MGRQIHGRVISFLVIYDVITVFQNLLKILERINKLTLKVETWWVDVSPRIPLTKSIHMCPPRPCGFPPSRCSCRGGGCVDNFEPGHPDTLPQRRGPARAFKSKLVPIM